MGVLPQIKAKAEFKSGDHLNQIRPSIKTDDNLKSDRIVEHDVPCSLVNSTLDQQKQSQQLVPMSIQNSKSAAEPKKQGHQPSHTHCQRFMDRGNKPVPYNFEMREAHLSELPKDNS